MGRKGYYIYNDTEGRSVLARGYGFKSGDPNPKYLWHYRNWLELSFIAKSVEAPIDRRQAEKELAICEEKLERCAKRPGFALSSILLEIQKAKRDWGKTDIPDRWSERTRRN